MRQTITAVLLLTLIGIANAGTVTVRKSGSFANQAASSPQESAGTPTEQGEGPGDVRCTPFNTMNDVLWTAISGAIGYNVYRSNYPGGPYSLMNANPITNQLYRDGSLSNGNAYYYVVRALFPDHISLPSQEVSGAPSKNNGVTPVTDLTIVREGSNLVLEWTPITNDPPVKGYIMKAKNAQMENLDRKYTLQNTMILEGRADPLDTNSYFYSLDPVTVMIVR